MNKTTVFRLLIVLDIVGCFLLIAFVFLDEKLLPAELVNLTDEYYSSVPDAITVLSGGIGCVALLLIIASWIGLLMLKKWGAWFYLASHLLLIISTLFGPQIMSGIFYTLDSSWTMLSGIILGMAFFSDVLN